MAKTRVSGQSRMTGGRWSHDAPESGSAEADSEAAPVAGTSESRPSRPSLGRLLVEAGVASEPQVKLAIAEGLETGEKLGEVLVRRGWATDEVLAKLLAKQWQLPFSTRAALSVDPSATKLIPLSEARELGALPIGIENRRVVVAITEPTQDLLAALRQRFGQPSCIVVSRSDLHSLLSELPPVSETAHHAEPIDADATEVNAANENPLPAQTDAPSTEPHESVNSIGQPPSVARGTLAESTLSSLEAAMGELERIHREIAALGNSLELAREQLAKANTELEAAQEAREQDAATIHRLESEISEQADLFETLRAHVATLNNTLFGR